MLSKDKLFNMLQVILDLIRVRDVLKSFSANRFYLAKRDLPCPKCGGAMVYLDNGKSFCQSCKIAVSVGN